MVTSKEALHRLIDELPEEQAERLLSSLLDSPLVPQALASTVEQRRAPERLAADGIADLERGDALTAEDLLIEKHIGLDYERPGSRADARLRESGVSIWAIVGYLGVYDGDANAVARMYELSPAEMDAALAYYRRNKKYIDARVLLNEA